MGTKKARNGMDLAEAEYIKKWLKVYIEELYEKDINGPDNHDGVITRLRLDILKCEVKGGFRKITMSKDSGGDGIAVELFKILRDDAVKVLHSICSMVPW